MKKFLLYLLLIIICGFAGYGGYNLYQEKFNYASFRSGGSSSQANRILLGASNFARSLPLSFVEAASTTTDSALANGGATLYQDVNVNGANKVRLNILAIGGTATSTLYLRPEVSYDGSNYFLLTTTTDSVMATSTVGTVAPAFQWDPGIATSTRSFVFNVDAAKSFRFLFYGDNLTTDPNDFVKAYIEAVVQITN